MNQPPPPWYPPNGGPHSSWPPASPPAGPPGWGHPSSYPPMAMPAPPGGTPPWGPGPAAYGPVGYGPAPAVGKPAWSPTAIAVIAFIFGALPAGIMHIENYERLGVKKNKPLWIALWVLVSLALLALALVTPDEPAVYQAFGMVSLACAAYFHRSQSALFAQYQARGGTRAPLGLPIALSVAWLVTVFTVGFGVAFAEGVRAEDQFEQARSDLEGGQYAAAEPVFLEHKKEYEDPAASYNLALVYVRTERFGLARKELAELRREAPTFDGLDTLETELDEAENTAAVNHMKEGRYNHAEPILTRLRKDRPRFARASFNLALLYLETHRTARAREELAALRAIAPDFEDIEGLAADIDTTEHEQARQLLADDQLAEALPILERLHAARPDEEAFAFNHAMCLLRLDRIDEAQRAIDAWLARHPDDADMASLRARAGATR